MGSVFSQGHFELVNKPFTMKCDSLLEWVKLISSIFQFGLIKVCKRCRLANHLDAAEHYLHRCLKLSTKHALTSEIPGRERFCATSDRHNKCQTSFEWRCTYLVKTYLTLEKNMPEYNDDRKNVWIHFGRNKNLTSPVITSKLLEIEEKENEVHYLSFNLTFQLHLRGSL